MKKGYITDEAVGFYLGDVASNGYKEVVELLVVNKAQIDVRDYYASTHRMWACSAGNEEVFANLLSPLQVSHALPPVEANHNLYISTLGLVS